MTQEKANKIFETDLGGQLDMIYVTSDDKPFIRYDEALEHALNLEDSNISFWYPEDDKPETVYSEEEVLNILISLFSEPEDAIAYFEQFKTNQHDRSNI
jgi:hypothetical protein